MTASFRRYPTAITVGANRSNPAQQCVNPMGWLPGARSSTTNSRHRMGKLTMLQPRLATLDTNRVPMLTTSWRAEKTSSTARGYGYKWQKARAAYLRAHPLCVTCEGQHRVTEATVVDHKVPHRGDKALFWDSKNWQSLCATHHSRDKQREEAVAL